LYKDYFSNFYKQQKQKVKEYTKSDHSENSKQFLRLIETIPQIPTEYLKHLEKTDGLYEIKVQSGSAIFRIFCFFDEG